MRVTTVMFVDVRGFTQISESLDAETLTALINRILTRVTGEVLRYEAQNLHALNFVAHGALGGGVSRSLSLDNYGKALSAAILGFELDVPEELAPLLRSRAPA